MTTLTSVVSYLSDYGPDVLPVAQARTIIRGFVQPVSGVARVLIRSILDHVLVEGVLSSTSVPSHGNSAMDGFAFANAELTGHAGEISLHMIDTAYTGTSFDGAPSTGEAMRVMTGAIMPADCDTIIPREFTQGDADTVRFARDTVRTSDNHRLRGEDFVRGSAALSAGRTLRPADIDLLALLGIAGVSVRRKLHVVFFSAGDGLRSIGEPLDAGCVYDSNRYTLHGVLSRLDVDLLDVGVVRDNPATLEATFRTTAENADAVITSGGVSIGEADFTKQMMAKLDDVTFWKIAIHPGRPMTFGRIVSNGRSAFFLGLPGNPVAVMVTFYHFVRGTLLRVMDATGAGAPLVPAVSATPIRRRPGRTEYQHAIAALNDRGQFEIRLTGQQGLDVLHSMSEANCFVTLAHEQGQVNAGNAVQILPSDGLI